jgi:ABC-type antimicrobial peptide transport system permease subunit
LKRRPRDIGIRLPLGAASGNVLWQVLRETLLLDLIGIAVGVPLALGGIHLVRSMIFGLGPADPVAILVAPILVTMVALRYV